MSNHSKGVLYALITALLWGVLAIALKIAVIRIDPATIVWFRFILSFVPLFIWVMIYRQEHLRILVRPPFLLVIATIMLSINYLGFNYGVKYTSPGNAQIFIQTAQILLALGGIIFLRERFTRIQAGGFLLAIIGLVLFYNQQLLHFAENQIEYNRGILLILLAGVAWATYAILQKILVVRYSGAALNLFIFGLPSLLYLPAVNFSQLGNLSLAWWLLLVFLGINTLISYTMLALSLKYLEASKISIILIMNPVITFILMGILGSLQFTLIVPEKFTLFSILGALTVLSGALLVIWKPKRSEVYSKK
jgi:drug/metabolite transporter (DMT)-like permease